MRESFDAREEYLGTGSLASYGFDFKIVNAEELLIVSVDGDGVEQFRVRGDDIGANLSSVTIDDDDGGTVVLANNLASGHRLFIMLADDEPTQPQRWREQSAFQMQRIEDALDRVVGQVQRLAWLAGRALMISDLERDVDAAGVNRGLAVPETAGAILAVNDDADGFTYGPTVAIIEEWKNDAETAANEAEAAQQAAENAQAAAEAAALAGGDSETAALAAQQAAENAESAALAAQTAAEAAAASVGAFWETYEAVQGTETVLTDETFDMTVYTGADFEVIIQRDTEYCRATATAQVVSGTPRLIVGPERGDDLEACGASLDLDVTGDDVTLTITLDAGNNADVQVKKALIPRAV